LLSQQRFSLLVYLLLPLADAVAITFIAPIIVTILSAYLLGERVGKRRWIAVIIGFFGTIMITQPSFDNFNSGLLFPFLAAIFFAIRQIISRRVSHKDNVQTTVAYTALTSFVLLSMCLPFFWVEVPSELDAITLLSLSAFSAIGEIFIVYALSVGLAVVVTPIHYTIIVWALLYGYFFFEDVPSSSMMFGTIVVMLCGIYIARREHRLSLKI
jgi:S-adenosylmethionine uptake transporter